MRIVEIVEESVERLDARERLHAGLELRGHGGREPVLQGAKDLDALDRVDAEFGFDILIEPEHLHGIARALAHLIEQERGQRGAVGPSGRGKGGGG